MAERLGSHRRPIGMGKGLVGVLVALPLVLAGCGDASSPTSESSTSTPLCTDRPTGTPASLAVDLAVDLDGDGSAESVTYVGPSAGKGCPAGLRATVAGHDEFAGLGTDLPVRSQDLAAVQVPGRAGALVLVTQQHPRGGFQARLFGYADGTFAELRVGGNPVFGFVATDVTTTPISAVCTTAGFEVLQARAHEPIGIVPAWDVFRTTYAVAGNTLTKGATEEVADNVLDAQLQSKYSDLVHYRLFGNCRTGS